MGICQSSALKVVVFDINVKKETFYYSMKKMRSFRSIGDLLSTVGVPLESGDKIFFQTHVGLEEITRDSQFQIRNLIIKNKTRVLKYRILMESMY